MTWVVYSSVYINCFLVCSISATSIYLLRAVDGYALPVDRVALLYDPLLAQQMTDRATVGRWWRSIARVSTVRYSWSSNFLRLMWSAVWSLAQLYTAPSVDRALQPFVCQSTPTIEFLFMMIAQWWRQRAIVPHSTAQRDPPYSTNPWIARNVSFELAGSTDVDYYSYVCRTVDRMQNAHTGYILLWSAVMWVDTILG